MGLFSWTGAIIFVFVSTLSASAEVSADDVIAARNSLEKTRQELQGQGFKTALTNFDFSTSPELRAREAIVGDAVAGRSVGAISDFPDLLEPAGTGKAIVVWQQPSLQRPTASGPDGSYKLTWDDFGEVVEQDQSRIAAASAALLAGDLQFNLNAADGTYMLLRHLPLVKRLAQTLNGGAMLALHKGNREAAWTNLLAATRLVTAWKTEPVEVSQGMRLDVTKLMFGATWQVLQIPDWTDDQLARLQREWESANFLGDLPEVQAFLRMCDAQMLASDKPASPEAQVEAYQEEERLLRFYCEREVEFRNAAQATNWLAMREMPGVTNKNFFQPKSRLGTRFQMRLNQRRITLGILTGGVGLLERAAEAEAERRVVITALALERFHRKHGSYPETLEALAPEFVKAVPPDFITGQPLHYRLGGDGHFLLYSMGLDGVDDNGLLKKELTFAEKQDALRNPNTVAKSDIVWPLAATSREFVALRKQQADAEAKSQAQRKVELEAKLKADREESDQTRKAAMKKLLAEKSSLGKEPVYKNKPLSSWVHKVGRIEEYHGAPEDAVAAIRAIGAKAVPFLLEWMPRPDAVRPVEGFPNWSDVSFAWWALGERGKSAIPTLARYIKQPRRNMDDYSVWTVSAKAISYLGPEAIDPMLVAATNLAGQHELGELLHNFENLGTNGAPAVPSLIHWANDPDYWVRDGVVSALGGIGKRADLAVLVLTNALQHDANWMVRRDAAEALGAFANDSELVLPELIKALKDPEWQARGGALSGLGKIQNKPEVVVPLIKPFLYDPNNVIQRTAAYALRDLGSEAGYRALLQASNAPSSWPGIGDIIEEVQEKTRANKRR